MSNADDPIDVALWRRRLAGMVLHGHLAGRRLPERIDGLTAAQAIDRIARMQAKEVLETLREIYELEHWDLDAFERAFLDGAIEGWKPGAIVHADAQQLRVLSATCPLAAEVEKDPRVCSACQGLQMHAARLALRGDVAEAGFDQVMSRGDGVCELAIQLRPRGRRA